MGLYQEKSGCGRGWKTVGFPWYLKPNRVPGKAFFTMKTSLTRALTSDSIE